jgi:ABC-2 type transport system permease protein
MNTATVHLLRRNLLVIGRNRAALAFTILQPILWMALFSQNFRGLADTELFQSLGYARYLDFLVPSMLVLTVLNASALSGISTVTDITTGVMDKLAISPIPRYSMLLGRILADVIAMAAQCSAILAIAFAIGARARTGVPGVAITVLLTLLLGSCAAALSDYIALRTRNAQLTMVLSGISTLPLLLLTPAFVPRQLQTGWLTTAEKANPVAYVVIAGQDLMNLGYHRSQLLGCVCVLALTALFSYGAAVRAFRRAMSDSGTPSAATRISGHVRVRRSARRAERP